METLLEQQRRYHEEKERIIDSMVKETIFKKTTQREIINSEHRQKILLDVRRLWPNFSANFDTNVVPTV